MKKMEMAFSVFSKINFAFQSKDDPLVSLNWKNFD